MEVYLLEGGRGYIHREERDAFLLCLWLGSGREDGDGDGNGDIYSITPKSPS